MQDQDKAASVEATVELLVKTFPACFKAEGDAVPLKIGIFQDISAHFAEDDSISNTRLRQALRRYTSSWRYLGCVKLGRQRLGLDGSEAGEITEEHAEHAAKQLEESKARAKARRKEKQKAEAPQKIDTAQKPKRGTSRPQRAPNKKVSPAPTPKRPTKVHESSDFSVGCKVNIWAGAKPVAGEVTDIQKDQVQVQLQNGLVMRVSASQLELSK